MKRHDDYIFEAIEEINYRLLEDRHIAIDVENETERLSKFIINFLNNFNTKNGHIKRSFETNLFNKKVIIQIEYDNILKRGISNNKSQFSFNVDTKNKILYCNILTYNNDINVLKIKESIQHELEHLYEIGMRGGQYKDNTIYKIANAKMNNRTNEYEYKVASVIYASRGYEMRAFANGAYAYISNTNDYVSKYEYSIRDTLLFKWYVGLKECLNFFICNGENDMLLNQAINQYPNLTFKKLVKITQDAIKNYLYLIGRIRSKAIDNAEKSGLLNEIHMRYEYIPFNEIEKERNRIITKVRNKYLNF